ncbi:MFS transporter [Bacteroidales bacterium]|nr:MFS transporter [Bacteroidales bacterium]
MKNSHLKIFIPILLSFFVMGMADIVGVATNFVREDFGLNDLTASIIPMMVFFWFAVFSIPTGLLMGRIGRKKTVLLAILIQCIALILAYSLYQFYIIILAFALLGIGNTILQVSLNPLVASIVEKDKLASTLTFGQFVKASSSFVGPILASMAARSYGDWKLVFLIFAAVSLLSFACLYLTPINADNKLELKQSSFGETLKLLKEGFVFTLFLGIVFIVGVDVCMNTNIPQLLIKRLGMATEVASLGSSLYFGARTLGAFVGAIILMKCKPASFLRANMVLAIAAFVLLIFSWEQTLLFVAIFLIGFTCANVFSIIFVFALQNKPEQTNEVSSLMIMAVAGGAVISPLVGAVSKGFGVGMGFGILLLCVLYLLFLSFKLSK